MQIEERLKLLEEENARLREENKTLREKLLSFLEQNQRSQVKKDSHNSHNPPSQDKSTPKKTRSRRKKSARKSEGETENIRSIQILATLFLCLEVGC